MATIEVRSVYCKMPLVQRQSVKFLRGLLAAAVVASPWNSLRAEENRYDVVSKLLTPFIGVLAKTTKSPNRALRLTGRLERLTGVPAELAGATAEVALQFPNRLRVHGPLLGETVTICRDRQQVWATPGARVQALLDLATAQKKLGKIDAAARLEPLQLPLPDQQLVFLPALLVVKDAGTEAVDGEPCRVLDLALLPELEKSLKENGWSARVWVRADYRPARLVLRRTGWELAVKFDRVEFSPRLPDETWTPPAEDVLMLDAPRFRQLLQAIGG